MFNCIIVDDQPESLDLLKDHISKTPQLKLVYMTTEPKEALSYIYENKPDIIFLDIEMPGLSGIEFVEAIKSKWGNDIPKVVFITGYSQYALEGYEHGVTDYLLKPASFSRYSKCISRILDDLNKHNFSEKPNFFFIEEDNKRVKINCDNIIYIEGAGNYIILFTKESRKIIYKSLNAILEVLPHNKFMRVHKSFIVAIDHIQAIKGNELIIKIKDIDNQIPIGITYKDNVLKQLGIN